MTGYKNDGLSHSCPERSSSLQRCRIAQGDVRACARMDKAEPYPTKRCRHECRHGSLKGRSTESKARRESLRFFFLAKLCGLASLREMCSVFPLVDRHSLSTERKSKSFLAKTPSRKVSPRRKHIRRKFLSLASCKRQGWETGHERRWPVPLGQKLKRVWNSILRLLATLPPPPGPPGPPPKPELMPVGWPNWGELRLPTKLPGL